MGLNTLNNRSTGQTILETFFNDIHAALNGDFVGRGSTGIPESGKSLGTLALPWGPAFVTSLNIDGDSLDTAQLVSPPNRIISGKIRATSNQPAFITPHGAALSATIFAAATDLVLSIGGAAVQVTTDIVKSSLTAAPAANNTCLVNDALAVDQADTRLWGENFHKKITVDAMGSNITALVGKYATFKTGTEYFMAYVESSTVLSNARRGYFYDSTLAPLNAVTLADNDTITLMHTGYLFMTNDAATVDVTYNTPFWGGTSPTSPVTGDYWYDTLNKIWKRYDGASFQIVNRILIGIVVMDSSACVAARCDDFYAEYKSQNSMELEKFDADTIRATHQGSAVNVAGSEIEFGETRVTFVGADDYAPSSTDRYAAFGNSTMYYLYIEDTGRQRISDIAPLYRPDLHGHYHRHNPWRCVGSAMTDGSGDFVGVSAISALDAQGMRDSLRLDGYTGLGAVNTMIVRYSSITRLIGNSFEYVDDADAGMSITIKEPGMYALMIRHNPSIASSWGISKNSTQLTTALHSITATDIVAYNSIDASFSATITIVEYLVPGDVLRAHTDATATGGVYSCFQIEKISH